jgi:hypothetical protein
MAPQSKRRHQLSQPTYGTERKPPGQIGIIPTIRITQPIHIGGIDPIITGVIQALGLIHRIGRIPTTTLTATGGKPTAAAAYLRAAAAGVALVISDDAGGRTLRSIGQLSRLQRLLDADVDYVTPHQRTRGRIWVSQR